MDDETFRKAMGKFTTGVTIVTTFLGGEVHGMTANAFMSVSLKPPLIAVSIDENAQMYGKMREAKRFAVSILSENQLGTSMHFAGQKEKGDIEFGWISGVPVINEALANVICRVYDSYEVGDHELFIGEVLDLQVNKGDPLVFFEGKYAIDRGGIDPKKML